MALVSSEEQELLRDAAREYVREQTPVSHLRELRDANDADGFSRKRWEEVAELGWAGIVFPESVGGAELGYAEFGVVLEECGRTLTPFPLQSSVLLAGNAILLGGSEAQQMELLPGVCEGKTLLALAHQERGRFSPYDMETKAEPRGDGYRLTGEKRFVLDGHVADRLIVAARTSGAASDRDGITLFLVAPDAEGVGVTRTVMVDSRNAARVSLAGVCVDKSAVIGEVDRGAEVLDPVFDRATIALSAEMLGLVCEVFDRTIAYLKTREQFGTVIGTFQALKHRAAEMFCEVELSRSIVLDALQAIDDERPDVPRLASAAKARLSDTASLVTCEGLQLHGGIGMTDEEEIGFFMKRAKAAELTLGDAAHHRDRFATLTGF